MPRRVGFVKLTPVRAMTAVTAIVGLDALTKAAVLKTMSEGETIEVIAGLFSLTYLRNAGAAFGMLADLPDPWRQIFFVSIALVTVGFLLFIYRGTPEGRLKERASIVAIVGGALGNLLDRFVYGEVIDFLDFYIADWHWPAFNLADSCITIGVMVLVFASVSGTDVRENPVAADRLDANGAGGQHSSG